MHIKNTFVAAQVLVVIALFAFIAGCNKANNPVSEEISTTNLFPTVVGHMYVYTGYDLDTTSSQKIQSTVHREAMLVQGTATIGGKTAYRLIDSLYLQNGQLNTLDTTYVTLENGNLLIYENGTWLTYFNKSAGTNTEYNIGQRIENTPIGPIPFTLKGTIYSKASITVPYGTLDAYKLEIKASVSLSGVNFETSQYIYFVDGIGPVQFTESVIKNPLTGKKETGSERVLVSKNF